MSFYKRLLVEQVELDVKIEKLNIFLDDFDNPETSKEHDNLLHAQLAIMIAYSSILYARIELLDNE